LRRHYYQFRRDDNIRPWNGAGCALKAAAGPISLAKAGSLLKGISMRKIILPALAVAMTVSACQTMTPEERRARDEETCRTYGFRTGSEAFAQCLLELELDRRAERRAQMDAFDDLGPSTVIYRPVIVRQARPKG